MTMTTDDDFLELITYNLIEIIMHEPLDDFECRRLIEGLERYGIDVAVNSQGRILTFEAELEQLSDITGEMADMGLVEDIGLIKHVTTFEPQWTREVEWSTRH